MRLIKTVFLAVAVTGAAFRLEAMQQADAGRESSDRIAIEKAIREKGARWTTAESWVSRLSKDEMKALCGTRRERVPPGKARVITLPSLALPAHFDWRDNKGNFVTSVKNQGACGSCWDFAAVAQTESWWKIQNNDASTNLDLSEQFILSCGEGDCNGASIGLALDFIDTVGVPTESCFPYQADDSVPCSDACGSWASQSVNIPGWGYVTLSETVRENIKQAVYRQPVAASFSVYQDFSQYGGGVYQHVWGDYLAGHAVLIVGWDDAEMCWIC